VIAPLPHLGELDGGERVDLDQTAIE